MLEIISLTEVDDETREPLFWSNKDGWVDQASADVYATKQWDLPIGGEWIENPRLVRCLISWRYDGDAGIITGDMIATLVFPMPKWEIDRLKEWVADEQPAPDDAIVNKDWVTILSICPID